MKKLFLSSSFAHVSKLLEPFLGETLSNKTITVIPTASNLEEYKAYVENDIAALQELGAITHILDVSIASTPQIEEAITRNDLIYVSGGNTFYLLQEIKKSNADRIIIAEIMNGKPYIGASAGSAILSNNIEYMEIMDDSFKAKHLTNYDALNIVDFYPLPHHTNEPFIKAVEDTITRYDTQINLIPISNTEVITVMGDSVEIDCVSC